MEVKIMKNIIDLYNNIKNINGVDIALVDAFIKTLIKKTNCETLEELVNLMQEKENDVSKLHDESIELSEKNSIVLEEQKKLLEEQSKLKRSAENKSGGIIFAILGIMGIAAGLVTVFPSILYIILAVVLVLITAKVGMDINIRNWSACRENEKKLADLEEQELDLNAKSSRNIFLLIDLTNSIQEIKNVMEDVTTFLESYAEAKGVTVEDKLTQDEVVQEETLSEEKGLHLR